MSDDRLQNARILRLLEDLSSRLDRVERELGVRRRFANPSAHPDEPLHGSTADAPPINRDLIAALTESTSPDTSPDAGPDRLAALHSLYQSEHPDVTPPPLPTDFSRTPPTTREGHHPAPVSEAPDNLVAHADPHADQHDDAPAHPDATSSSSSLERLIGGKFYLIAGSIVVVIGVGLFLKLGYDAGWFRMAPLWKCLWGGAFGVLLLALGEVARRKVSAAASAGISSAGMGTLFAATYAAHGVYAIIGAPVAFALLLATTAIGITIAARARLLTVALLSIIVGYAAPFMLTVNSPSPYVLPLHLLALLTTGLILSGWRPQPFRPLRALVWWATMALGAFWMLWQGDSRPELALIFLAFVWGAVHTELMIGARPLALRVEGDMDESRASILQSWDIVRPIATSFTTSAWCALLGVFLLRVAPVLPDWFVPAGIMSGALVLAIMLSGNLRLLRDTPATEGERLGAGLLMQGGAMLIAVVALALQGWLEVAAWLALGAAATGAASWVRAKSLGFYGVVILSIATARLLTYDAFTARVVLTGVDALGLIVDRWTLLMVFGVIAWGAAAAFLHRLSPTASTLETPPVNIWSSKLEPSDWRRFFSASRMWWLAQLCVRVGVVLAFVGLVHPKENFGSLSIAWIALSLGVLWLMTRLPGLGLGAISTLGLCAATFAWDQQYLVPNWGDTAGGHTIHPGIWNGVLLVGALLVVARTIETRTARIRTSFDPRPAIAAILAYVLLGAWSTMELLRHLWTPGADAGMVFGWTCIHFTFLSLLAIPIARLVRLAWFTNLTFAGLTLAVCTWFLAFIQKGWTETVGGFPVHRGLFIALIITGAMLFVARLMRIERTKLARIDDPRPEIWLVSAVVLMLTATSFEIARLANAWTSDPTVQSAAVSIWWGVVAAVLLFIGFRYKFRVPRSAGLGLLGVATVKAVVVDLADVPPIWRVASVLCLGLLMLGVAVVYAKASDTFLERGGPKS